jgi:hypothetical protein
MIFTTINEKNVINYGNRVLDNKFQIQIPS